jgi:hypothetical protein
MEFLARVEQIAFFTWVRESPSLFAYPTILLLHTIGMGLVVGISAGIDLRILGVAPEIALEPMRKYFPVFWIGFWMNAISGAVLLLADATTKLANWDFYLKMVFIVLALVTVRLIRRRVLDDPLIDKKPLTVHAKLLAMTSLIFWFGAITAGRLLAYLGPVSGLE